MKYAVALAGGGTKGSYQIGVWKAMRELGVEIECVAGTSIGAINGAAMVMGEYELAKRIWERLDYSMVFENNSFNRDGDFFEKYENIKEQLIGIARKRGLDISPLRKMLERNLDEKKIRKSDIDLIIVTVSLSELKPVYAVAKDIPEGQIVDYILASAALPIFQRIEIDGNVYLDGGTYDVFPINTLIERGYKNIIAIDLGGGIKISRRVKDKSANITYIRNSSLIGGMLEFNPKIARKNIRLGYLDALKAFGHNYGKTYFIRDSSRPRYTYPMTEDEMAFIFGQLNKGKPGSDRFKVLQNRLFKNLRKYTDSQLDPENSIIAAAEIAAETFEIDRVREYSSEALVKKIMKTHRSVMRGFIPETHRIDRLKKNLMKHLVKGDEFPGALMLMTMPKIFITNLFIYIMKKRMETK